MISVSTGSASVLDQIPGENLVETVWNMFLQSKTNMQLMVNCWFGLMVWIFGIPL